MSFDRTYRYGTYAEDGSGDITATDVGEDDCVVNVKRAHGDNTIYVDIVVPFAHINNAKTYFVYDPTVEAEDDDEEFETTMLPVTTVDSPTDDTTAAAATADTTPVVDPTVDDARTVAPGTTVVVSTLPDATTMEGDPDPTTAEVASITTPCPDGVDLCSAATKSAALSVVAIAVCALGAAVEL